MRCAGLFLLAYQPTVLTEAERMASRKLFGARDETPTWAAAMPPVRTDAT